MPSTALSLRRRWLATTILTLILAPAFHAQADSLAWDGDPATGGLQDGGGNWDTTATNRWTNGTYQAWVNSGVTPDSAIFGQASGAAGTVTLTTAITAGGLTFNAAGSGAYTIASSTGTSKLTLAGAATPVVTANVNAAISGVLDGTSGFTKLGAGTLTLSGTLANTLSGTTNVTAGTLTLSKTAGVDALSDDILINGGILLWLANNQVKDTASITLVSGELGFNSRSETIKNLSIQGGNANSGGGGNGTAITITDTLSVSSTGTLGLNSAGQWSATTVAFSGGARTVLTTTGNNTTTMTRVTVGAGGLSMTGQTVALNKGTADSAKGSELLLNGNVTSTGTNSFTFGNSVGSSQVNLGTTVTWETTNLADVTTINPVVTGSGGLTKTGLGALKLYGAEANTYQGTTTVSAGTLNLGKTAGVDAIARDVLVNGGTLDWDISNQLNDLVNITMTSGALKFDGLNETFASLTQSGGNTNPGGGVNGGTITITGTLRVSGGSMVNLNSSGVWTVGKADFTGYSGTVLNLNGNATTMNRFIVGAGGLVLSGQTISLTKATLVTNKGSELVLDGDVTASGNNAITSPGSNGVSQVNLDGAVRTWNVTGGTTTSSAAFVSNTLTPTGDGATPTAGGLIKSGAGSLVLTGDNTYTGATTVSAGTLLVHGTLNGTSGVAVEAGTFGGRGVVTAPVTVAAGASLQAGDGNTGTTLQVDGDLSLTGTAVVKLTLGGSLAHSTLTRVGGTWTLASNLAFTFTGPGVTTGLYENIITGLLGTETWLDDMGGWQITNAGYVGQFIKDGTTVDLNITAVPEPGAAFSLLGGLGLLLGVTRRRRRTPGR